MEILYYLLVIIIVAGEPIGVKFKDFDTFAINAKLEQQMSCEEFTLSKNRDVYMSKYFAIEGKVTLEPICLTPAQLAEWIEFPRKYKAQSTIKSQNEEGKIVKQDPPKEYSGFLRFKESSNVKSVEAYQSTAFYLEIDNVKQKLPISSSEKVSFETLQKFINAKVKITAEFIEQMPSPLESYPLEMGSNGKSKPMTRKFNRVLSIKLIK
jgi:hypothetical protein